MNETAQSQAVLHAPLRIKMSPKGPDSVFRRCPRHVCFPSHSDGIADIPRRQLRAQERT